MSKLLKSLKITIPMTVVASLGLLPACSQLRDLKEMHDATTEMRDTTKEMNAQTKTMGANTEEMKGSTKNMEALTKALSIKTEELEKMTAELYRAAKQGTSMALREELLKKIMDSKTHVEKLSKTAKFFMAFEYQIWSGVGPDSNETRDKLTASAVREFMREIQRFTLPDLTKMNPVVVTELALELKAMAASLASVNPDAAKEVGKSAAEMEANSTFNAFAVTMHLLNPIQEDLVEGKKVEKLSMYSMIQNSLLANREIEAGNKHPSDYPEYVGEVRSSLDVAASLVIARAESLALMALARVTPLATAMDKKQILSDMKNKNWEFVTDSINSKVIRDGSLFLKGAIEAREFMKQAGIKLVAGNTKPLFIKGQPTTEMKSAIDAAKAGSKLTERQAALAELAGLVEKFLTYD